MKLLIALIYSSFAQPSAEDRALKRLDKLTEFGVELIETWYEFLPSQQRWIMKFENNRDRMARAYGRCGNAARRRRQVDYEDEEGDDHVRYNQNDPRVGTKQILTGLLSWTGKYISTCQAQLAYKHQEYRLNKWYNRLQQHLKTGEETNE